MQNSFEFKNDTEKTSQIRTDKLRVGYCEDRSELVLLNELSIQIPAGTLTGVIGINGAGKSTLLKTLSGVHKPLKGKIYIADCALEQLKPTERSGLLSVVLTDPPASGNLSVFDLVSLGRHPYTNWIGRLSTRDREIVTACLERMDLVALSDHPVFNLSDGQLQRVLIARALAQDTPIILLDEPTSHLDLYHKVSIFKTLKQITQESDKTVVFTTHEIDLAIQLCDYILIVNRGSSYFGSPCELIESGAFEELFPNDTIVFNPEIGRFQVNK